MGKLSVFNFVTLNGFYKGSAGDISWHKHGEEGGKLSEENLRSGNILLFGRVTYEMMANFWPSPMAYETFPAVAEGMNNTDKIVFSKTLKKAEWKNTRLVTDNIVDEIKALKKMPGKNMTILGSGSIVSLFAEHGLVDEYQFMIDPIAIGDGTPIFKGIGKQLDLKLTDTKILKSGAVLLSYQPL